VLRFGVTLARQSATGVAESGVCVADVPSLRKSGEDQRHDVTCEPAHWERCHSCPGSRSRRSVTCGDVTPSKCMRDSTLDQQRKGMGLPAVGYSCNINAMPKDSACKSFVIPDA